MEFSISINTNKYIYISTMIPKFGGGIIATRTVHTLCRWYAKHSRRYCAIIFDIVKFVEYIHGAASNITSNITGRFVR